MLQRIALLTSTIVLTLSLGCVHHRKSVAQAIAPQQVAAPTPRASSEGDRIKADPIAYIRDVYARTNALEQYRLTFYRQERWGNKLRQMEQIQALYRKTPFSVKFVWEDPNAPYYESVYVEGQNDNKLIVRERKGAFPLVPPMTRKIDPGEAVKLNRSKNPITDFGLAQVTARTLAPADDPAVRANLTVRYQGVVNLEPQMRPAHHLHIEHPPAPGLQYTAQDFYVDTETQLPAGTDLYLPGGDMDARYRYANVETNVHPTDADFRLGR
jgi:hypothetical protein